MTLYSEGNEGSTILPAQQPANHKWLADAFPVPEKESAGGTKKKKIQERPRCHPPMGDASYVPNSSPY